MSDVEKNQSNQPVPQWCLDAAKAIVPDIHNLVDNVSSIIARHAPQQPHKLPYSGEGVVTTEYEKQEPSIPPKDVLASADRLVKAQDDITFANGYVWTHGSYGSQYIEDLQKVAKFFCWLPKQQQPQPASEDEVTKAFHDWWDNCNGTAVSLRHDEDHNAALAGFVAAFQLAAVNREQREASEPADALTKQSEEIGLYEATTPERPYACDEHNGSYLDEPTQREVERWEACNPKYLEACRIGQPVPAPLVEVVTAADHDRIIAQKDVEIDRLKKDLGIADTALDVMLKQKDAELAELRESLYGYKAGAQVEADLGDEARAEVADIRQRAERAEADCKYYRDELNCARVNIAEMTKDYESQLAAANERVKELEKQLSQPETGVGE